MLTKQTLFRLFRSSIVIAAAALAIYAIAADSLQTSSTEELGEFLVDGEGMSVYLFLPDEQGPSTCTGDCLAAWPAVTAPEGFMEEIELGTGVNPDLVGTSQREDGSAQVTYNRWPLYYFANDVEPGDTVGQGVGSNWFLVSPEGEPIGAESTMSGDAEDASSESEAVSEDSAANAEGDAADDASGADMQTLMAEGQGVYMNVCASCHGADGDEANVSHAVKLTESERAIADAGTLLRRVLYGGSYMPAFGNQLTNEQVAAVTTYVRNSWGYDHPMITVEEVVETRERFE